MKVGQARRWPALVCSLVMATLGCASAAAAAAATATTTAPLTVVTEQYPPLSYSEDGIMRGYAVEIVERLLARTQSRYTLQAYPWARAYEMARQQPNVLIFSMVRTTEREDLFHWIGPIGHRNVYLYKLAARADVQLRTLADVKNYTTSVNRGDIVHAQLVGLGLVPGRQIDLSNTSVSSVHKLLARRVDLIASTEFALAALCARAGVAASQLERTVLLSGDTAYFIAASRNTPMATVTRLRQELAELQRSGALAAIAEKYALTSYLK